MNVFLDLVISHWYIVIPIIIIILIIIIIGIKKGYLKKIDLFGIKLDFESPHPKSLDTNKSSEKLETPIYSENRSDVGDKNLQNYKRSFTNSAINDIQKLGLTQDRVIDLVQSEFLGHLTYFLYDILDYPLPVQKQYIVVLDKVGETLTVRAVKQANWTELELASWSSILGLYRRATRHKYRTETNYVLTPEVINMIWKDHIYILEHILRHFLQYKKVDFEPTNISLVRLFLQEITDKTGDDSDISYDEDELTEFIKRFPEEDKYVPHNIISSLLALNSIPGLNSDIENQIVSQKVGDAEIVLAFERSLQYIHKIILSVM